MGVYFLLDRSGSMANLWSEALTSINEYVKNLPAWTNVKLATFDSTSYDVIRDTTASMWHNLSNADATPRSMTPLYDSAARMMQGALDTKDERAIFIVMTDGFENCSKKYTLHDVKILMDRFKSRGWEIIFLGAEFDQISDVASSFKLGNDKFMNISKENLRSYVGDGLSFASSSYLTTGNAMSFSPKDKMEATAKKTTTI